MVSLRRLADYCPDIHEMFLMLTVRKREIFKTGVEASYYEIPREVTRDNVGRTVGSSVGSVCGHLQKVETKVVSALEQR